MVLSDGGREGEEGIYALVASDKLDLVEGKKAGLGALSSSGLSARRTQYPPDSPLR